MPRRVHPSVVVGVAVAGVAVAVVTASVLGAGPQDATVAGFAAIGMAHVVLAVMLVPWRRPPAPRADQVAAFKDLPIDQRERGQQLSAELRPVRLWARTVAMVTLVVVGLTPVGSGLVGWLAAPLGGAWAVEVLLAAVAVTVVGWGLGTPFLAWSQAIHRRYGLAHQTWRTWTADQVKSGVLLGVITAVLLFAFFGAARLSPGWWWAWASVLVSAVMAVLTFVFPVFLAPIFNNYRPLPDGPLRDRLLALAARDGVRVEDVFVEDASRRTRRVNAHVGGFGPTRRIVLADTLLQQPQTGDGGGQGPLSGEVRPVMSDTHLRGATDDEITAIVAHELAHAKYGDVVSLAAMGALRLSSIVCGLYLLDGWSAVLDLAGVESVTDPRAVGLVLVTVLVWSLLMSPATNLISRRFEARADGHALELTGDPVAFESVWRHVVEVNVADPRPGRIRYLMSATHPSIVERMATARAYRRRQVEAMAVA